MDDASLSQPSGNQPAPPPAVAPWEWACLSLVVLIGLVLRLSFLPHVPGLWYDEAINGLDALKILREPGLPLFFDTNNHMREPMFLYLELLGVLLGGTTATAIRAVSLVVGVITIPVVWWLAREWKGPMAAILAAVLIATLRWHIVFSCLAFRTILAPLFLALAAICYLRLLRQGKWIDALLCGAMIGAGAYTYLAFRLVPLIFLGPMVMEILRRWRMNRDDGKVIATRFGGVVVAAFVVFLPLGVNYLLNPHHFTGRGEEVSLMEREDRVSMIAGQARDVALMAAFRGDHEGKHNVPGPPTFLQLTVPDIELTMEMWQLEHQVASMERRPPRDPHGTGVPVFGLAMGVVFYIGFFLLVFRMRSSPAAVLIVSWLLVGSLASVLSFGAPNMLRLLFLVPAVVLVLVAAILAIIGWVERVLSNRVADQVARLVTLVVILLPLAVTHLMREARLLKQWPVHPMVISRFNVELADVGNFLREEGEGLPVLLPRALYPPAPTLAFLADGYTFWSEVPADAEKWWELRTKPPFPPLEPIGTPVSGGAHLTIIHPMGIPFADLMLVHQASIPADQGEE